MNKKVVAIENGNPNITITPATISDSNLKNIIIPKEIINMTKANTIGALFFVCINHQLISLKALNMSIFYGIVVWTALHDSWISPTGGNGLSFMATDNKNFLAIDVS